jgi:hydrogenase expression/formation protein HypE
VGYWKLLMKSKVILLAHGSGGKATHQLIDDLFIPNLGNRFLAELADAALLPVDTDRILFTTDSYVVDPPFFPGGDIGRLAVNGTVNDLAVCGGRPLYLSLSLILEEGFPFDRLEVIIQSIAAAAREAGVMVVTGDTKVVGCGSADKIFITTSGVATLITKQALSIKNIRAGDAVLLSGSIGDHGIAVMLEREGLELTSSVTSDTAPLNEMTSRIMAVPGAVRFMRDPTRGGIATTLNEIAQQTGLGISISEAAVPIKPEVAGASEILGLDPLYIANEGKLIAVVAPEQAEPVLQILRASRHGSDAAIIGTVTSESPRKVILKTRVGGSRIVDMLAGEQLPRIC